MVRKRDSERPFPPEIECRFCGATLKRHCKRCSWYPCKANKTITRINGFQHNEGGGITWVVTHRSIAPEFFYLK